jgi:hypothetical protein
VISVQGFPKTRYVTCTHSATVEIPLSRGYVALIDAEDAPAILPHKWYAAVQAHTVYAVRTSYVGEKKVMVYMHRAILGCPDGVHADHIDHDGLNNRRRNLRPATPSQNRCNAKSISSLLRGVRRQRSGRFQALIRVSGKCVSIGTFNTVEEAGRAYDAKATEFQKQYAVLNFPATASAVAQ